LIPTANSQNAQTYPVIYISSNGDVTPSSTAIHHNENNYVFTEDILARGIVVQKENVTIDGAGHTLMGPYNGTKSLWIIGEGPDQEVTNDTELWSIGVDMATNAIGGLTIQNLNIKNFSIGMYLWTNNNNIKGNAFIDCIVGILLSGDNNTLTENYIANNEDGVFFGSNQPGNIPINLSIYNNRFVDNLVQLSGCVCSDYNTTEPFHEWDNGFIGNFWSNYSGLDHNGDGIGDTPYVIDPLNLDRYPLVKSSVEPPQASIKINHEIVLVIGAVILFLVALTVRRMKTKKVPL
jgi:Periplasmic copper-binding protein (NosD)